MDQDSLSEAHAEKFEHDPETCKFCQNPLVWFIPIKKITAKEALERWPATNDPAQPERDGPSSGRG